MPSLAKEMIQEYNKKMQQTGVFNMFHVLSLRF